MKKNLSRILACTILLLIVLAFSLPASGARPAANQAASSVYLPLVQNNYDPSVVPPTSLGLIDKDREAGTLDAYTAALYKLYTLIPDSPLPVKYIGAPDENADIAIFRDILEMYDTLTSGQKAQVDPYLRRPDEPTSALFQFQQRQAAPQPSASGSMASATRPPSDIDWGSVTGTKGVVVHYRKDIAGDLAKAEGVRDAIDAKIYTSLSTLMNAHMWRSDADCSAGGLAANGGSEALDIYLIHGIEDRGVEYSCKNPPTPGWVVLNADRDIGDETHIGMIQTAAHEMFHAVQDNYSYLEAASNYLWVQEATAKWVEDYVYHNAQSEHDYANLYLAKTEIPMDYMPGTGGRYYGEYLWPFYLTRVQNKPVSIIRNMFEQAATYKSVEVFMQRPGSDNPVLLFPDFAVMNWNQAPFDAYQTADSLTKRIEPSLIQTISGVTTKTKYELTPLYWSGINWLTATYYDYKFTDNTARTVAFYNGLSHKLSETAQTINFLDPQSVYYKLDYLGLDAYDGINVTALIKINNTWTREDWSDESYRVYCRDRKAQRLQELVLIVTNGNFKSSQPNYSFVKKGLNPTLQVSPTGCYQWSGTFDMADISDPGITHTLTGNVTFEADPDIFIPDVFFTMKSGGATLTLKGESSDGVHRFDVGGSASFTSSDPDSYLDTYNLVTGGPHPNAYYGWGQSNATVNGKMWTCCDEDDNWVEEDTTSVIGKYFMTPNPVDDKWISQSSGNIIDGSYTEPNGYITYHWHFQAVTEP
jgi:hypothetical protein